MNNKLSQQCIEAIEKASPYLNPMDAMEFTNGATEALTNPSIYEKAGLISLEDAFGFLNFTKNHALACLNQNKYLHRYKTYTADELFQIYQQQKEK